MGREIVHEEAFTGNPHDTGHIDRASAHLSQGRTAGFEQHKVGDTVQHQGLDHTVTRVGRTSYTLQPAGGGKKFKVKQHELHGED